MVAEGVQSSVAEVVPGVWERATALSAQALGATMAPLRIACGLPLVLGLPAALVPVLVREATAAAALDLLIAAWAAATVARSVRSRRLWAPLEVVIDHERLEHAEFRRETGSKRPRGRSAVERWLLDHPTGPGRVSYLVLLGRFGDADRELAVRPPDPISEEFLRANDAAARVLYTGGLPDLQPVRAAWERIFDPAQRHLRRECLALEEAMAAAASGRDPVPILAAARRDVGFVSWRSRVEWLVARTALVTLVIASSGWLVRLALGS